MKRGLIGSAVLHAGVIALVVLGLPELFKPEPREDTPVVFEVVTVAERATAPNQSLRPPPRPLPKPEPLRAEAPRPDPPKAQPPKPEPPPPPPPPPPKPEPAKPEPPKPEPPKPEPPKPAKVEPPRPEPPKPEPPKPPRAEPPKPQPPKPQVAEAEPAVRPLAKPQPPKPEPPKPEPPKPAKVEPPKPEPPKPEPPKVAKAEPPKPEPPKPKAKVEPKPKVEAKKDAKPAPEFDVNAILNNLRPTPARQPDPRPPTPAQQRTQTASSAPTTAPMLSQNLTSSETDAVRQQIERCWSFVGGGKEVQDIVVDIRVQMNPDATVREARIVDGGRGDPLFRSVAESARRAILNPECSPLRLPRDKYDLWKSFTFTFRPRDFGT